MNHPVIIYSGSMKLHVIVVHDLRLTGIVISLERGIYADEIYCWLEAEDIKSK